MTRQAGAAHAAREVYLAESRCPSTRRATKVGDSCHLIRFQSADYLTPPKASGDAGLPKSGGVNLRRARESSTIGSRSRTDRPV